MTTKTWILVADEAIARILALSPDGHALDSVEEIADPLAHATGTDMRRDAVGRRASGANGNGANATASAGEGEQHHEAREFAQRVAQHLDTALQAGRFEQLQIVAAPRFLGLLRQALSTNLQRTVAREMDKDFVHFGNDDIAARLFPRPEKR